MQTNRPNILMIMADQLSAEFMGTYGHPLVKTPNIDALAARGTTFESAYTNCPICAPSRASMVTGRYVSNLGAYDNGTDFPASTPTFMHHLRRADYEVALSGKMHFIGPDQKHGFDRRLTPEIYPSGFNWTPDWTKGPVHNPGTAMDQIRESGLCDWSMQLDYDEAVHHRSLEALRDFARRQDDGRPFFLCASYTHPHDPFTITKPWWDLYDHDAIDMPAAPAVPIEEMHPYNRWLQKHHMADVYPLDEEHIRNARHAYYGMVSYFDHKVGELTAELERLGMADNTIIMVTSDHGEMLGEHGMWFKRTFYEPSIHVPLVVAGTDRVKPGHKEERSVSLVDLAPTFLELAEVDDRDEINAELDGQSLCDLMADEKTERKRGVICEYYSEGVIQPMRLAVKRQLKYVYVHDEEPLLFDLTHDPDELQNCFRDPIYEPHLEDMKELVHKDWDAAETREKVIASQRRRHWINDANSDGKGDNWDVEPDFDASKQFVREQNAQATSEEQRYPHFKRQRRLPLEEE